MIVGSENTRKRENGKVENGRNGQIIHHAQKRVAEVGNQGGNKSYHVQVILEYSFFMIFLRYLTAFQSDLFNTRWKVSC